MVVTTIIRGDRGWIGESVLVTEIEYAIVQKKMTLPKILLLELSNMDGNFIHAKVKLIYDGYTLGVETDAVYIMGDVLCENTDFRLIIGG